MVALDNKNGLGENNNHQSFMPLVSNFHACKVVEALGSFPKSRCPLAMGSTPLKAYHFSIHLSLQPMSAMRGLGEPGAVAACMAK